MSKEENVITYYVVCNKLKNTIRDGWTVWNVQKDRLESVAEHVYSTQMLALAINSEYNYDIDIFKVLYMLAIHEVGECAIGDMNIFKISPEDKRKIEHEAVHRILGSLLDGEFIENMFLEFDNKETKEAKYAFLCDKLECDLQAKIYDEEGLVDLNNQSNNKIMNAPLVKSLLQQGYSFGEMWLEYSRNVYPYDENFRSISLYASNNKILKKQP